MPMVWSAPVELVTAPAENPFAVTVIVALATGLPIESDTVPEIEPICAMEISTFTLPFAPTLLDVTVVVTPYINDACKSQVPGDTSREQAPAESVTAAALPNPVDSACTTAPGIGTPATLPQPWSSP